jgi:integrase
LQTQLNDLAGKYSESIVKHAFVNLRSIMRVAHKLKFIAENPGDDTGMPDTRAVERPTITPEQINCLIQGIEEPHDLCLMCIGLFCATRTSETFGLQWKSYLGDSLMIHNTAYEGRLYRGQVKTEASRNAIPIPDDIVPVIEAWRHVCPDISPDALMFPTYGTGERTGEQVPRRAKNFLKWRIHPIADRLKIPRKLVTFQVMRRTLGTDLQKHGTMKDAQVHCGTPVSKPLLTYTCSRYRRASGQQSTRERERFWQNAGRSPRKLKVQRVPTCPSRKRPFLQVSKKIGSSGRIRTYNPPVNSRMLCH